MDAIPNRLENGIEASLEVDARGSLRSCLNHYAIPFAKSV